LIGKPYQARQDANVWAAPTTDARVVAGLRTGETIDAVGKVEGRDWYMIARNGRSIGYVSGGVIGPARVAAQTQLRNEPVDLDAIELDEGVVVDTVSAHTECRTLDLKVAAGDSEQEETSFEACKAADGAWELG
jgi:predicted homoserine dehydrogenase-like protein